MPCVQYMYVAVIQQFWSSECGIILSEEIKNHFIYIRLNGVKLTVWIHKHYSPCSSLVICRDHISWRYFSIANWMFWCISTFIYYNHFGFLFLAEFATFVGEQWNIACNSPLFSRSYVSSSLPLDVGGGSCIWFSMLYFSLHGNGFLSIMKQRDCLWFLEVCVSVFQGREVVLTAINIVMKIRS